MLNYPRFARGLVVSRVGRPSRQYLPNEYFRQEPVPAVALFDFQPALERLIRQDERLQDDSGGLRTPRSVDYLRWRYAEHPTIPYWAVFIGGWEGLQGVAIFRTNTRCGLKEVILCELILGEPEKRLVHALLEQTKSLLRADHLITYFPQGSFQRRCLERWGFHSVPRQGMNFTVRALHGDLPADPQLLSSWRLSLGDLELF